MVHLLTNCFLYILLSAVDSHNLLPYAPGGSLMLHTKFNMFEMAELKIDLMYIFYQFSVSREENLSSGLQTQI